MAEASVVRDSVEAQALGDSTEATAVVEPLKFPLEAEAAQVSLVPPTELVQAKATGVGDSAESAKASVVEHSVEATRVA